MSSIPATHVIQVTNVAPAATLEQMKELFGYLGRIRDIKLYPSENYIIEPQSRVCYVEYYEKWSVGVAQHLTNTVFIDRALIVVPIADEGIPSESTALALTNPSSALPGLVSSGPNALINEISGVDGSLVITTTDPKLTALGLPQYPPLPANLDPVKIEEIRRTVTVGNLDSSVSADNLLKFVNQIGEVKFLRMAGDGIQITKFAFVEFSDQSSVPKALQYNGVAFEGRPLIINHSTTAIIKPLPKNSETAQKEIDEAMKRVREAQSLITAAIEPELSEKERRRSRRSHSRSRSRRRSASRSRHKRRSRSHSKSSRSHSKRSRSRSKRSRSSSKRSRSHSKSSRSHSKGSRSRSKRSRSRSKRSSSRSKRSRSRQRSRDRHLSRTPSRHSKHKSRSASRERKKVGPHYKKGRSRSRSMCRDKSKKSHRSKSRSPSKSSSKSKSRKSKRSKEKTESRERERSPKENKSVKDSSNEHFKSGSYSHKGNSQSCELYGPPLPIPELNSSLKEDSKSPVRCDKRDLSRSHSRSPTSDKRNKYKRTPSRSLSKESSSSHKIKSRSVSKHRSRSQSRKRSRSRSKPSSRKICSPSRHHHMRHHSRSITPSSKRESYSPVRHPVSRQRKSSKQHSISSRQRSLTPKRKSRTPRRRSQTPVQQLRSPKHRSRSRSYHRSCSPRRSRAQNSPPRSSKSPKRHSSSFSTGEARSGQMVHRDVSLEKDSRLIPSYDIDGANIDSKVTLNYEEEGCYNLETIMHQKVNEHIEYIPDTVDNNYNSGYNSGDMDLGSD